LQASLKSPAAAIREKLEATNQILHHALSAVRSSLSDYAAYDSVTLSISSHEHRPDQSEAILFDCVQMLFKLQLHTFFMVDKKVNDWMCTHHFLLRQEAKDNQQSLIEIAEILDFVEKELVPCMQMKQEEEVGNGARGKKRQDTGPVQVLNCNKLAVSLCRLAIEAIYLSMLSAAKHYRYSCRLL
jgi:hypothetical protein